MEKGKGSDKNNFLVYGTLITLPPIGALMTKRSNLPQKTKNLLYIGAIAWTCSLIGLTSNYVIPTVAAAEIPIEAQMEEQYLCVERPQYENYEVEVCSYGSDAVYVMSTSQ